MAFGSMTVTGWSRSMDAGMATELVVGTESARQLFPPRLVISTTMVCDVLDRADTATLGQLDPPSATTSSLPLSSQPTQAPSCVPSRSAQEVAAAALALIV